MNILMSKRKKAQKEKELKFKNYINRNFIYTKSDK